MCNQVFNKSMYMLENMFLQSFLLNSIVATIFVPLALSKLFSRQKTLVKGKQHKISFTKP